DLAAGAPRPRLNGPAGTSYRQYRPGRPPLSADSSRAAHHRRLISDQPGGGEGQGAEGSRRPGQGDGQLAALGGEGCLQFAPGGGQELVLQGLEPQSAG